MIRITLKAARVNANLTQKRAAELIGVDRCTLQNYESGKTIPNWDIVTKISAIYNMPADVILFGYKSA